MKKFEQFKVSRDEMKKVLGGRCPAKLQKWGECEKYWGSDIAGVEACYCTCHDICDDWDSR